MLSTLVDYWKTEDAMDDIRAAEVGLIVPTSYTTLRTELTEATRCNLRRAIEFQIQYFPSARIAFSSCSYPFHGAEDVENELRTEICRSAGIEPIIAEPMVNSVDEALSISDELCIRETTPRCILLVTGELHSPSVRYIWSKLFPYSRILIACIPYQFEVQPDHLVLDQRKMWKWVLSNIKREIALRVLPLNWVRKIQHKRA
jgi:hypothetical protein